MIWPTNQLDVLQSKITDLFTDTYPEPASLANSDEPMGPILVSHWVSCTRLQPRRSMKHAIYANLFKPWVTVPEEQRSTHPDEILSRSGHLMLG